MLDNKAIKLEDFTVLVDILARLRAITPEQVVMAADRLTKKEKGERDVGGISELGQVLHTLSVILGSEMDMEGARAKELADKIIVEDHEQRSLIASELQDVVRQLCWTQARTDTGYWGRPPISASARAGGWWLQNGNCRQVWKVS